MITKITTVTRFMTQPLVVSIGLHGLLLGGVIYASLGLNADVIKMEGDNAINVVMVNPAMFAAPVLSMESNTQPAADAEITSVAPLINQDESSAAIEPDLQPVDDALAVVEPTPVKPVIKPQPKPEIKPQTAVIEKNNNEKTNIAKVAPETAQNIANDISAPVIAPVSMAPASSSGLSLDTAPRPLSRSQPQYPKRAFDMRLEGRVSVRYDVNEFGRVENIRILSSEPNNMFDREVRTAMRKWQYERKAATDLEVTIIFRIKGGIAIESTPQ